MKFGFELISGKIAITPCLMVGGGEVGLLWLFFLVYVDLKKRR